MPIVGETTFPTARKQHICCWCGETIEVGEQYERWLWKDGRELVPVKVHQDCREAWGRDMDTYGADVEATGEARRGMTIDESEEIARIEWEAEDAPSD